MSGLFPEKIEIDPRHIRLSQLFTEIQAVLDAEQCDGDEAVGSLIAILEFVARHSAVSKHTATSAAAAFANILRALIRNAT